MGNKQSQFEALIIPHAAGLLRFARRLCGSKEVAEDLVQEALLRAWRGIDKLRDTSNPRAWVFRILINTWYSEGRRRNTRPVESPLSEAIEARQTAPGGDDELLQALTRLPDDQRTVLLLSVVEGFTGQEIGTMLEIPLGTVMSRLSRARGGMRALLSGKMENRKAGVGLQ